MLRRVSARGYVCDMLYARAVLYAAQGGARARAARYAPAYIVHRGAEPLLRGAYARASPYERQVDASAMVYGCHVAPAATIRCCHNICYARYAGCRLRLLAPLLYAAAYYACLFPYGAFRRYYAIAFMTPPYMPV